VTVVSTFESLVAPAPVAPARLFGELGDAVTRLLAGPPPSSGPEDLAAHTDRLGPLHLPSSGEPILELVNRSRLAGRGGGEFPVARKLSTAATAGGDPIVVVNGSEGEPASRKDRTLLAHRPHLVLDGAAVAARAVGARDVVLYVHATARTVRDVLARAIDDRHAHGTDGELRLSVASAPDRYVAGESSAVVSALEGRGALPARRPLPVAAVGVRGRPTVVSNVESVAHLALLLRFGADWFVQAGSGAAPGSSLLTLAGSVAAPGTVVEVLAPVRFGEILGAYGVTEPPPAVLIGGYAGRWARGDIALDAPVDRAALKHAGLGLGCGLVAPLSHATCGLATTLVLLEYLAAQSAGQCGSCVLGLPSLAADLRAIVEGVAIRSDVRRLIHKAAGLRGRGDCAHPDGAIALLESALDVFAADVLRHARGRPCGGSAAGWFPTTGGAGGTFRG
jgi:NADH:ubiquinone oxidoreductase subunit F (NADH-binding)